MVTYLPSSQPKKEKRKRKKKPTSYTSLNSYSLRAAMKKSIKKSKTELTNSHSYYYFLV